MYTFQMFAFLSAFVFYFTFFHIAKSSTLGSACFFYLAMSSLVGGFYPGILNPEHNDYSLYTLRALSLESFAYIVAMFGFVFTVSRKSVDKILTYLSLIAFFGSFWVIYRWYSGQLVYGLMLNSSMEGTFLAVMAPVILFKKRNLDFIDNYRWLCIIPSIAVVLTQSSVGIGGFCLAILINNILEKEDSRIKSIGLTFSFAILFFSVGYLYVGNQLFSDSLRFICWDWSWNWWKVGANKLFGTGAGTFWGLGPWIQIKELALACDGSLAQTASCAIAKKVYQENNYYTFMHNDWLQSLFEYGFVGLSFFTITFFRCIQRSFSKPWLISSVITFSAVSFINMPARYVLTSIAGLCFLRMATEKPKELI